MNGPTPVVMYPANDRLIKGWEKTEGRKFFRKVLKSSLRFLKDDYLFWKDAHETAICNNFEATIYRIADESVYFTGRIFMSQCKFDYSRGMVELSVEPEDVFTCITSNLKTKVNWLAYGTPVNCYNVVGTFETVVCQGVFGITTPADAAVYLPLDCISGGAAASKYIVTNHSQYLLASGEEVNYVTEWTREVYFGVTAPDETFTEISVGKWVRPAAISPGELTLNPVTGDYLLKQDPENLQHYYYHCILLDYGTSLGLDNGRRVSEVLPLVLDTFDCDLSIASDFFNINPQADVPTNTAYTRAAARLQDLLYYHRADVVRWSVDANSIRLEYTFEEFLNSLIGPFNCGWTIELIDDVRTLRIEHVSYFEGTNQNDFTVNPFWKYIRGKSQFDVEKSGIPKYDEFTFGESKTDYFGVSQILYQGCSSTVDSASNSFSLVSNDLSWLSEKEEGRGTDGFTFVAIYEFNDKNYIFNDHTRVNGALSFRDILPNYWLDDRPSIDFAIITGSYSDVYSAESLRRLKKQVPISMPITTALEDDFNPARLQKSGLGWGAVDSAEIDTLTRTLTINLLF